MRWPARATPPALARALALVLVASLTGGPAALGSGPSSAPSSPPASPSPVPSASPPGPPPRPVTAALEADERLLVPAADVLTESVEAAPAAAAGALHSAVDEAVSFEEADDANYVRAAPGSSRAAHRVALSAAPSGNVVRATVYVRASAVGADTSLQLRLFDGDDLVASGPVRPLYANWGWVDLAEEFPELAISSAEALRVEMVFDDGGLAYGSGRYSLLWVRVGLKVSLLFDATPMAGGGSYTAVAISPSGRTLMAGSARGGLYRSARDGNSFVPRNAAMREPTYLRIASITYHATRPRTLYAAAGTRGTDSVLLRSDDDGRSWREVTGVPGFSAVPGRGAQKAEALPVGRLLAAWDARDGTTWLWAATYDQGIMRSADGGATWKVVGLAGEALRGLALDPTDPDRLYVAVLGSGVWVTSEARAANATFEPVPGSPASVEELAFVGDTLWLAAGRAGIFRLEAGEEAAGLVAGLVAANMGVPLGTATWAAVGGYEVDGSAVVLAACGPCGPEADGRASGIIRTQDEGASWHSVVGPGALDGRMAGSAAEWPLAGSDPALLPDDPGFVAHQLVARGPLTADGDPLVVVAADGALWRSTDGGDTWRPAVRGLGGVAARSVTPDPRAGASLLAGVVGLGLVSSDQEAGTLRLADPRAAGVTSLRSLVAAATALDADSSPPTLYVALADEGREPAGSVLASADPNAVQGWYDTGFATDLPGMRPTAVTVGRDEEGRRVLLATAHPGGGVVRKIEAGPWLAVDPDLDGPYRDPGSVARAELAWVAGGQLVYLFDPTVGLYRSADAGESWTLVWAHPSNQVGSGGLAMSPDGDTLFVATIAGLFRLTRARSGSVPSGEVRVDQLGTFRRAADVFLDAHARLWVAGPRLAGSPARLALSWDPFSDEPAFLDLATLPYVNGPIRPDSLAVLPDGRVVVADAVVGLYRGTPSDVPVEPWMPPGIRLLSLRQDPDAPSPLLPEDPSVTPTLHDPFTLYVAADGDDAASGLGEDEAVASLARAHEILVDRFGPGAALLDRDVLVRVRSGTYLGQYTTWTFSHPGHVVRIAGYAGSANATRPLFIGCAAPSCPAKQPWFQLQAGRGEPTNVQLVNLAVSKYFRAVVLQGGADTETQWNGYNVIHLVRFHNIGTRYRSDVTPEVWSPGIVILRNSRHNLVWDNEFVASSNRMAHTNPYFHSVYASNAASDNVFRFNRIVDTSGDFHIRDRSDRNVFAENRIVESFYSAVVTEWLSPGESESCETEISANVWRGDWYCELREVPWVREVPSSDGRCGSSGLRDYFTAEANEYTPAAARCERY